MHAKEHRRYNDALRRAYPAAARVERFCQRVMSLNRRTPKAHQLAVSCSLEHFTALFADHILSRQERFTHVCEPAIAAVWLWHAAEETEHKAVCFDVYQHVRGKGLVAYLHRIITMFFVSLVFCVVLLSMGKLNQSAGGRGAKAQGGGVVFLDLFRLIPWRLYFAYYRPSFHPWDHRNEHLLDEWKRTYADFGRPLAPVTDHAT
jgi:predicted metal-dependent hydrolase